jgi:hypothetical protein
LAVQPSVKATCATASERGFAARRVSRVASNRARPPAVHFKIASEQFGRRSRARGQVREHPAAVLDCDLELVAFEKYRFSSQPLDFAFNFRRALSSWRRLRSSVLRMVCGSRLLIVPPGGWYRKQLPQLRQEFWPSKPSDCTSDPRKLASLAVWRGQKRFRLPEADLGAGLSRP